jgi:hypothetical protein
MSAAVTGPHRRAQRRIQRLRGVRTRPTDEPLHLRPQRLRRVHLRGVPRWRVHRRTPPLDDPPDLDAPLASGGVPVAGAHPGEHPALVHAHHTGAVHRRLPGSERVMRDGGVVGEPGAEEDLPFGGDAAEVGRDGAASKVEGDRHTLCLSVYWF